jgi:LPS sulfotransferase NodH
MSSPALPDTDALTPGQRLHLPEYDLPPRDPSRGYLVLSPQRTGSNYLCRRLCNVRDRFGMPSEYLNPIAVRMLASRLLPGTAPDSVPFAAYMRAVQHVRTSADGWFGIKVQPGHVAAFAPGDRGLYDFAASYQRIVVLTRRDKLGQAISGTIAEVTGTWFNDGTPPAIDAARIPQLFPAIAANLARYIEEDRRLAALGKALDRPWLRLVHEDILADGQGAFECVVEFLAGEEPAVIEEDAQAVVPVRPPTDFAEALRERFLHHIAGK